MEALLFGITFMLLIIMIANIGVSVATSEPDLIIKDDGVYYITDEEKNRVQ